MVTKPLYQHTSQDTAYLVTDYPYGGMRCQIKFWIEHSPTKGYRFCSQTENPKTGRWNAPKKSTYSKIAGCMFLDEKGHCTWDGLTEYSSAEDVSKFLTTFRGVELAPEGADMISGLRVWCAMKIKYLNARIEGKIGWKIGGKEVIDSDHEKLEMQNELKVWQECITKLNTPYSAPE